MGKDAAKGLSRRHVRKGDAPGVLLEVNAEGEGFEPSNARRRYRFSRPADSTTLAPFRKNKNELKYTHFPF